MENYYLMVAIVIALGMISHLLAFISGMSYGAKLEEKRDIQALNMTFDAWTKAQEEAGVTEEQMAAIQKKLAEISKDMIREVIEDRVKRIKESQ